MNTHLKNLLIIALLFLLSSPIYGQTVKTIEATISLQEVFGPFTSMDNGLEGAVNSGGKVEVKIYAKQLNTLVYQAYITATTTSFGGTSINYHKNDLGAGAIYYPNLWDSKDFKTALFAIDRKRYDGSTIRPYPFLSQNLDLRIEIRETNGSLTLCKIPALGIINRQGGNALFHPTHYCYKIPQVPLP